MAARRGGSEQDIMSDAKKPVYRFSRDGNEDYYYEYHISPNQFNRLLNSNPLLSQFLDLEDEILQLNPYGVKDPLKEVVNHIVDLGLNILGRPTSENSYTTIVTEALEVFKKKREGFMQIHSLMDDQTGVVEVNPRPRKGFVARLIDRSVKRVVRHLRLENASDSVAHLKDGFAPVPYETSPTSDVRIKGQIPEDLNGMMIRNGPNPAAKPLAKYTLFDGDSLLHAIHFKNGEARYASHFVRTSKYKQEEMFEQAEFLKIGDLQGTFGLYMACVQLLKEKYGILDMSYGWLRANTALIYHDGHIMAVEDHDKPYVIHVTKNGDIHTVGINHYYKDLKHDFLPHPKKDLITGDLFFISCSYTQPHALFNVVSKDSQIRKPTSISIPTSGPIYVHDFGITDHYVILMDLPYYYDPKRMVEENQGIWKMDHTKTSRFGILPKYAESAKEIHWFEFKKALFIFHNANSWEEDEDTIVLVSCVYKPRIETRVKMNSTTMEFEEETICYFTPSFLYTGPSPDQARSNRIARMSTRSALTMNRAVAGAAEISDYDGNIDKPRLYKMTFNMRTGQCRRRKLSDARAEYPIINKSYEGRKTRYIYAAGQNDGDKIASIIKYDLEWDIEVKMNLGKERFGSEAVFVPHAACVGEDDGYLTTFVFDERKTKSFVYVIDAQRMELLSTVELPGKVPYGFHALFVTERELDIQKDPPLFDH